ncbi:hypothetical protein [Shimia aestuarii]|uniref:Uncharacterized protein n=1 Tax=Shimia aestuarii TaxID=254406 RepID=A0A1I4N6Z9_9RHOB|nr:hypothetical protein [Shimia aestuarii]SFM11165.1 hypothetical protein SAMN04488042_10415 [Shimia aestuarii]
MELDRLIAEERAAAAIQHARRMIARHVGAPTKYERLDFYTHQITCLETTIAFTTARSSKDIFDRWKAAYESH